MQEQDVLTRQEGALLFWLLSYASLLAPSKHSLRSTFIDLEKSAVQWKSVAMELQGHHQSRKNTRQAALLGVALCVLEGLWCTCQSDFEGNWEATGAGIRKAAALHLFSASHTGNGMKDSLINTANLVQKLLVMDRWIAFTDLRALGIHPSDVTIQFSLGIARNLRSSIEQIQIGLLESARELTLQYNDKRQSRKEVYHQLRSLLQTIDEHCSRIVARYTAETGVKLDPSRCAQKGSAPHAAVLLSWLASCAFIACSTSTRLSSDPVAPADVRLANFTWANHLLILVPAM